MSRTILESLQGFMIYVDRKYWYFNNYLKGIHLNISILRPGRYEEGRKLPTSNLLVGHSDGKWDMTSQGESEPLYVEAVLWLDKYLEYLERLTDSKETPV